MKPLRIYLIFILIVLLTIGFNLIARKIFKSHWNLRLGFGIPALFMILFMWRVSQPVELFSDFHKAYYPAGKLILQNPSAIFGENGLGETVYGFVNIPIIALLFTPFSLLDRPAAHFLLVVVSGLALLLTLYCLFQLISTSKGNQIGVLGLFVINGPLYYSLREGNSTHIVLPLLAAALVCLKREREIWSGVLVALAALIKLPILLLCAYFFLRMQRKVILGISITLITVFGLSLVGFGIDLHINWFQECILNYMGKPLAAYNNQSIDGFLARLLTDDNLFNWEPLRLGLIFKVLKYAITALLIGCTLAIFLQSKSPTTLQTQNLEFSIVLCLSILISPISWSHYYLLLLLPLSLYIGNGLSVPNGYNWLISIVLSILLISPPVLRFSHSNPMINFLISKLFISHYFLGGLVLFGVLLLAQYLSRKPNTPPLIIR
ncbi:MULTISPECIES: glycosyltransferase family 87 protein [unclassified Coleofasciculus]|uniref:glycosyltransferase family 87 protein n=1 Tax=unclassified Coleofasciculus TaxID=2692782 RepID=UPI0018802B84|nr:MULTISPECIES: glycosyltransferase family 87 protein [unclassified Coleofasciculus]MBE9125752.1 DUF2029 domain-containing protein [Coleofasciculus sp. LEGE 07081]MBE9147240.1 DUF2029 domain-containing protein [Coleofasciculus sp. LEGE 07092]